MEWFNKFSGIVWVIASIMVIPLMTFGIMFFFKDRIYRYPAQGWLDISVHPIPDDLREYIGTDGEDVRPMYGIVWGPHGKIIFNSYNKTYLKYWQPLPEPPKD